MVVLAAVGVRAGEDAAKAGAAVRVAAMVSSFDDITRVALVVCTDVAAAVGVGETACNDRGTAAASVDSTALNAGAA